MCNDRRIIRSCLGRCSKTYKEAQETFEVTNTNFYLNCEDFTGIIPGQNYQVTHFKYVQFLYQLYLKKIKHNNKF